MSTLDLQELFASVSLTDAATRRMASLADLAEPRLRYIIAMTPRSGSSLLCDIMKRTRRLGDPGEKMEPTAIRGNVAKLAPGRDADEYLRNILKASASPNGVSGLKASWFQFNVFRHVMADPEALAGIRYIHLTRRDMAQQAVSLYRATASKVFHTDRSHSTEALARLHELPYDFARIDHWHEHLKKQEAGWQRYFSVNRIFPLHITYEDIDQDVRSVVQRIAMYLGLPLSNLGLGKIDTVFKKLGDRTSIEWACQYTLAKDALHREGGSHAPASTPERPETVT